MFGSSDNHRGVRGVSKISTGVNGIAGSPAKIQPDRGCGIHGESVNGFGVCGVSDNHEGVRGASNQGVGVFGSSDQGVGIHGESVNQVGVIGTSQNFVGVWAETKTINHPALIAKGVSKAAVFEGDVEVTGDIRLVNADCAEDFDIICIEQVEPGTVMVIDSEGALRPSDRAYDKRVAGVISGAGSYKPALILDKQESSKNRMPIALMGKVYCKVDASYGAIEVGDLLTTSPTLGHAMKADDPIKAFGALIGKALRPLASGEGLIPILIALQ
ncbi:hypothetical protein [Calothrix sp. 336/3]|uniref:hypothetical protein n=1 Tax=Calothrix sp. 336/3 TaxID=1337936 RepID=UPI0011873662|nr:hypothetical protein [Calothrix sp. 336/3]